MRLYNSRRTQSVGRTRGIMLLNKFNRWFAISVALIILTTAMQGKTNVSKQAFGQTSDGTAVDLYTLADGKVEARITNYGGIVVSLRVPDRTGKLSEILLGFHSFEGYRANPSYFGAIVGRYANRIAHGSF